MPDAPQDESQNEVRDPPRADTLNTTQQLLANIWQRNLPVIHARLDLLDRSAAAALAETLSQPDQEEAAATAHKLAGSLGMYGFPQGSILAHALENEYELPTLNSATLQTLTQQLRLSIFPTP